MTREAKPGGIYTVRSLETGADMQVARRDLLPSHAKEPQEVASILGKADFRAPGCHRVAV